MWGAGGGGGMGGAYKGERAVLESEKQTKNKSALLEKHQQLCLELRIKW